MIHFSKLIRNGHGLAPVLLKRAVTVTLDWDAVNENRAAWNARWNRSIER